MIGPGPPGPTPTMPRPARPASRLRTALVLAGLLPGLLSPGALRAADGPPPAPGPAFAARPRLGVAPQGTHAILAVLAQARGDAIALPSLGDGGAEALSLGTERRLGDRIMRDVWRDPAYLDDPVLLDYVRSLWQPLVDAARSRGDIGAEMDERFAWRPFLVEDKSVNAFALPGGHVGVHLGLIALTASSDELASVLAHELTHVSQRHIARGFGAQQTRSIVSIAALILGVLAASRSPQAANAMVYGSQAVAAQGQLNYSREMEREADRLGHAVLIRAGYDPAGMAAMFEKLLQASRLNDSQNFPYLRSHPLGTERLGEARSRLGLDLAGAPPPRSLLHAVMQGRARVLMDARALSMQRWQSMDAVVQRETATAVPERLSAAYASALASVRLRDFERARAPLALARSLAAPDPAAARTVALLALEAELAEGRADAAAQTLASLAELPAAPIPAFRAERAALLARGELALLRGGEAVQPLKPVVDSLQTWVARDPQDALAWALLGRLWDRLQEPWRGLRAAAESRVALGDLQGAIDRLSAAQGRGLKVDHIEASVVDARLRELRSRRQREQLDERQGLL